MCGNPPSDSRPLLARLLLCAVLLAGLCQMSRLEAAVFRPDQFVLGNGLQAVVVSDRRVPVVTHMVWYRIGSADDPPGQSGLAHFLEHLMFKGTDTLEAGEASRLIAGIGGEENALTGRDHTAYFQTVAPEHLGTVMGIEADRMVNLRLTEQDVETERAVILEERRTRTDNDDAALLAEQANAALYLAHPYRIPPIGWAHEIRDLSLEQVRAFYSRWYAPNNAILVVAGDVAAEEVRRLAEATYGVVPRRALPERRRVSEPPHVAPRRLRMTTSQVGQPRWSRRYLAPSYGHGNIRHVYALQVLDAILGGGSTSRLYRSLVIEDGTAVSAGSWYRAAGLGPASFGFFAVPAKGRTPEDVEAAIDDQIRELLETGISEEERMTAIRRLRRAAIFARDSVTAAAGIMGRAMTTGRDIAETEAWPERIAGVTTDDIRAAAHAVFRLKQSVTSTLMPELPD